MSHQFLVLITTRPFVAGPHIPKTTLPILVEMPPSDEPHSPTAIFDLADLAFRSKLNLRDTAVVTSQKESITPVKGKVPTHPPDHENETGKAWVIGEEDLEEEASQAR